MDLSSLTTPGTFVLFPLPGQPPVGRLPAGLLLPGAGTQSYCKNFGDVSPLALETIFDAPIQKLEHLALRLRSVLVPTTTANQEIALAVLDQLASA